MKVTLEELQTLRSTLTVHRLEHERLVTQMQVLRQNCRELRTQVASTLRMRAERHEAAGDLSAVAS